MLLTKHRAALTFAVPKAGYSKAMLQRRLFEAARLPAVMLERYIGAWTNLVLGRPRLAELAQWGDVPALYGDSDDPQRPNLVTISWVFRAFGELGLDCPTARHGYAREGWMRTTAP